ncbi:MAG: hypothetical protein HKN76_19650 [Saprospiraceae bacterium]|nr:hypothetical protein [Saprospiraceae bacterium]
MITEKDIQIIESYLSNNLSEQDSAEVRRRLKDDPEFRKHLEIIRDLPPAITSSSDAFRSDLKEIMANTQLDQAKTRILPLKKIIMAIAATVALFITVNLLIQDRTPQDLYATYFTIPPENISVRNSEEVSEILTQALAAYSAENYVQANEYFRTYLNATPEDQAARFFYSLSLMASNNFEEAKSNLLALKGKAESFNTSIEWYLSLVYLKNGLIADAKVGLTTLSSTDNSYTSKAQILLKEIE